MVRLSLRIALEPPVKKPWLERLKPIAPDKVRARRAAGSLPQPLASITEERMKCPRCGVYIPTRERRNHELCERKHACVGHRVGRCIRSAGLGPWRIGRVEAV